MKAHYFLILLPGLIANNLNAQWINSLTVSPANPKTTDTIYVFAECSFPSGSCDQKTQTLYINSGYFYGQATHCLGMLTYICDATDTFMINPLPAGSYNFVFNVNYGAYPAPCSPGINPGPTDSISFTVSDANAVFENDGNGFQFNIFPNPVTGSLHLVCRDATLLHKNVELLIYSLTGRQLFSSPINKEEMSIDLTHFPNGIYMCRITGDGVNEKQLIEVKR